MENVNKQLLDAVSSLVDGGAFDLTDSPKSLIASLRRIVDSAKQAAAEQAQQAEPVAWKSGSRPPSVFKTSEAGRQYVADFFANALRRHDFSSYIKGHLAADFACALSDGLHAMQQGQPPAVAVLQAELDEWRKLRDPKVLHVNLCRGFPAKLTAEQLLHIAGDEKQSQPTTVAVPDGWLPDGDGQIPTEVSAAGVEVLRGLLGADVVGFYEIDQAFRAMLAAAQKGGSQND